MAEWLKAYCQLRNFSKHEYPRRVVAWKHGTIYSELVGASEVDFYARAAQNLKQAASRRHNVTLRNGGANSLIRHGNVEVLLERGRSDMQNVLASREAILNDAACPQLVIDTLWDPLRTPAL